MYTIFPESFYHNSIMIHIVSVFLLAYAGFFVMPVLFLSSVHVKNFCYGRTTNERLSSKGPNKNRNFSEADSQRSESVYSTSSSMKAVNLVNEIGKPTE